MEPTAVETVDAVEPSWPVRELLPLDGWFPIVLLCGFAICLFVLLRTRKKHIVRTVSLSAAFFILCLATWYFYPSITYKGTYTATYDYLGDRQSSVVDIGDKFAVDALVFDPYRVSPLQRILWVSLPEGWLGDTLPVKLGWNSISVPTPKVGWVEYKRQRN